MYIRQLLVEGRQDEAVRLARYLGALHWIGGFIDCLVVGTKVIATKKSDGAALSRDSSNGTTHLNSGWSRLE